MQGLKCTEALLFGLRCEKRYINIYIQHKTIQDNM